MMNEMVRRIEELTGLSERSARAAAQTAVDYLDGRLPPPVRGNLEALLAGDSPRTPGTGIRD